MEIFKGYMW